MMPISTISIIHLSMSRTIGLYDGHMMTNLAKHLRIKFQIIRLECFSSMAITACEHQTKCKTNTLCTFSKFHLFSKFCFLFNVSNWSVSSSGKLQRIGDPQGSVKPYLTKFNDLEKRLVKNGIYKVETPYNRVKLPHLITWFQTDEAMVMLLSNHSVQVSQYSQHFAFLFCTKDLKGL